MILGIGQLSKHLDEIESETAVLQVSADGDAFFILKALQHAIQAARMGHNGVGAVIKDTTGEIVSYGRNETKNEDHPDAFLRHAELMSIIELNRQLPSGLHIPDEDRYSLYSSLKPCGLCTHGILLERRRIGEVIYGGHDLAGSFDLHGLSETWQTMLKKGKVIFRQATVSERIRKLCDEVFTLSNTSIKSKDTRSQ